MAHYVGAIRALRAQDGRVLACGLDIDNGRGVKFWASAEALKRYHADQDEDAYLVVDEDAITWLSRRDGGRSLWSCAGLT